MLTKRLKWVFHDDFRWSAESHFTGPDGGAMTYWIGVDRDGVFFLNDTDPSLRRFLRRKETNMLAQAKAYCQDVDRCLPDYDWQNECWKWELETA